MMMPTATPRVQPAMRPVTILMAALCLALAVCAPMRVQARITTGADTPISRYTFTDLAEKVSPSVVTVYVSKTLTEDERKQLQDLRKQFRGQGLEDIIPPEFRKYFDIPDPEEESEPLPDDFEMQQGSGSGVVISEDGYILTNWHVVGNKDDHVKIAIRFSDESEIKDDDVKLVFAHQLADLALLKVDEDALKKISKDAVRPIAWGDSDNLKIGEMVAAIGSPLDLRQTVTAGIICAKHRDVGSSGLGDMIQTDAVINPGSSGGALVNLDGELIGINRLITTRTGMWQGYGFAIPSSDARRFAEEVTQTGKIAFGYIGITMGGSLQDTRLMREALGLDLDLEGVLVVDVSRPDEGGMPGPAYEAGLRQGDFITEVDGQRVKANTELLQIVARKQVGDKIKIVALRSGEKGKVREKTFRVKVAERPDEKTLRERINGKGGGSLKVKPEKEEEKEETPGNLGMMVEPYEGGGVEGLKVRSVEPRSPASKAGIKAGDILVQLNFNELNEASDLSEALKSRDGEMHVLSIVRDGRRQMLPVKVATDDGK